MADFNDEPISCPSEDKFGFDPFAKTIAKCIKKLQKPVGSVVAIYGPWGSGKSSAINLIRVHLDEIDPNLKIVRFQCWLYRTEDALAVGFFRELYAGLSPSLSNSSRARKSLRKLGAQVAAAGDLLGVVVGATTGSFLGKIFKSASGVLENYMKNDESIESLQHDVAEALNNSNQRFLVVVDDIDRLSPDEALVIFRLIKSIGRLPNVVYLLAYDRERTERAVRKRYPSEGSHYLEKIVQAGFELPEPSQAHLIAMLKANLNQVFGNIGENDPIHMGKLFHEIVVPEIRTPRDVHRLANAVSVTYPAVADEVDVTDFLSIETLRLFRPKVYQAVRTNKSMLVSLGRAAIHVPQEHSEETYIKVFLKQERADDQGRLKIALVGLFPRLVTVWSNINYIDEPRWAKERRACSAAHFDTYFQFSLSPYAIPHCEIQELIDRADDQNYVRSKFREALSISQAEERTKASFLLDEMSYHSKSIPLEKVSQFLGALYSIADDFLVEPNGARGSGIDNCWVRLRWLTYDLLFDRTDQSGRSFTLLEACQDASLGWLFNICASAHLEHFPLGENEPPVVPEKCLMTKPDVESIQDLALRRVRESAKDGTLITAKHLAYVLFQWHIRVKETSMEVCDFCRNTLDSDIGVVALVRAFLGHPHSQAASDIGGLSDLAYHQIDPAKVENFEKLMDLRQFRRRLDYVMQGTTLNQNDKDLVGKFAKAWDAHDWGED